VALLQGSGEVAAKAETYMRISFLGAPFVMIVLVGEGYARGVQRMSVPLKILVASNIANVILEVVFVYGFHWDIAGSAWGTVIAQAGAAAAFLVVLLRAARGKLVFVREKMRALMKVGGELMARTGSLLIAFNVIVALLAAHSTAGLAANQVIEQIWLFIALALDSIAIAAQSLVGSRLGADAVHDARAYAARVGVLSVGIGFGVLLVLAVGHEAIPQVFTNDAVVLHQISRAWWLFALMQPINAAVFGWDGVLMGAGDMRYLMYAMIVAASICIVVAATTIGAGWGVVGAWTAITALICIRFAFNGLRVIRGRWAVAGASAP
jgi:putative MATE family efflux protein